MIIITSPELMQLLERIAVALERQTELLDRISGQIGYDVPPVYEAGQSVPFTASPPPAASADHSSPAPETRVNPVPFAPQQPTSPTAAAALDFISGRTLTPPGGTPAAAAAAPAHPWQTGQPVPPPAPAGSPTPWETAAPAPSVSADVPWNKPPA